MEKTNRLSDKIFKNKLFVQAATTLTAIYYGNMSVFCSDMFTEAETGLTQLFEKLWNVAKKLLPVAMAICIISLFITHDERKLETEKRILIAMCVAYALLFLIHKGSLIPTIEGLFGGK